MSRKHLYLYISRNDHKIQDMLRKWHDIEQNREISPISRRSSSCNSNWSMHDVSHESLAPLRTLIIISGDDWNCIRAHDVSYKGRNYKVLRSRWTDVIQEQLWQEHKLPCCYAFKNPKVSENPR